MSRPRQCRDCGATAADGAMFEFRRTPKGCPTRCAGCAADPGSADFAARVAARRAELAALRAKGRYRAQKPSYTTPLFAGLRPGGGN